MNDTYVRSLLVLNSELETLRAGIREHRDARGDDRCWQDDVTLYRLLPEGFKPPAVDSFVELERCKQYIACRMNPATNYTSPQRRIDALVELVKAHACHSFNCAKRQDGRWTCTCGLDEKLAASGLPGA